MSISKRFAGVLLARSKMIEAEDRLHKALVRNFPVDAPIRWQRSGFVHRGVVVRHSYSNRLQVKNTKTGKTLWINAFDMCGGV